MVDREVLGEEGVRIRVFAKDALDGRSEEKQEQHMVQEYLWLSGKYVTQRTTV
jgi:hypothetical protein